MQNSVKELSKLSKFKSDVLTEIMLSHGTKWSRSTFDLFMNACLDCNDDDLIFSSNDPLCRKKFYSKLRKIFIASKQNISSTDSEIKFLYKCLGEGYNIHLDFCMLSYKYSPHIISNITNNALCLAIRYSEYHIVVFLLYQYANISYKNYLPLRIAVKTGDEIMVQLLINNAIDLSLNLNRKDLPLDLAVRLGDDNMVKMLIKNGADVHVNDDKLLLTCCESGDFGSIFKVLIDNHIDVFKHYPLIFKYCTDHNRNECLNILIQHSVTNLVSDSKEKNNDFNSDNDSDNSINLHDLIQGEGLVFDEPE